MNVVRNYQLIVGVLGILFSGCSELSETEAPLISRTLIEEKLNSLNLSDSPPQWITSSGKSGGRKGRNNFDYINSFSHVSLKKNEREKFYQAIVSHYEDAGFKRSGGGSGSGAAETRSYTFEDDSLEIHLVFVQLGTSKGIELLVGNRGSLDDVLIIEYSKPK